MDDNDTSSEGKLKVDVYFGLMRVTDYAIPNFTRNFHS